MFDPHPASDPDPRSRRGPGKLVVLLGVAVLAAGALGAAFVWPRVRDAGGDRSVGVRVIDRSRANAGGPLTFSEGAEEPEPLVDLAEIISGGPPPDGIPPIDEPKFQPVGEVDWLADKEPVVAVEIEGDARAYPLQILTWHEIVNDVVGDVPVTITFCPLCNTAYGYIRPEVNGEVTTFGTSGSLYHSNLVMYDRASDSLWPQALGQAVAGPLTGATLERVPTQISSWSDFRSGFPQGQVLTRDTGFDRRYGENPYPGYDDADSKPFLFTGEVDGRLAAVERVLGVEESGEVVAFPYFRLKDAGSGDASAVNEEIGDRPVVVLWVSGTASALDAPDIATSRDVGSAAAFKRKVAGRVLNFEAVGREIRDLETLSTWNIFGKAIRGPMRGEQLVPLDHHDSFWFDWAAFHPQTSVWGGDG